METNLDLRKHPQQVFLILLLFVKYLFFHICFYLGYLGVEGAMCKILELYDQNPWTNYWSKMATLEPILQRPHIAVVNIMHPSFAN